MTAPLRLGAHDVRDPPHGPAPYRQEVPSGVHRLDVLPPYARSGGRSRVPDGQRGAVGFRADARLSSRSCGTATASSSRRRITCAQRLIDETRSGLKVAADAERAHVLPHLEEDGSAFFVEPSQGWRALELREIWTHRELLYFLTWRDVKVRYKQTAIGAVWAVLQPFLTMVVFTLVFHRLAKIPSEGVPYPVFAFTALIPWMFFSNALTLGANSVVMTPELVTKIYFPRLIIPAASVLGGLVDFAISFVVLIAIALYYGIVPGLAALLLVPLLALATVSALGVALWLSALNVQYRDVRYAVPFLVQLWLFATPVAYPSSLAGEPWRTILGLNPMAGVVEGFRWALLGTTPPPGPLLFASIGTALALLVTGFLYFHRVEDRFADII
jgi:lipopolysaccharide transport system permease protein